MPAPWAAGAQLRIVGELHGSQTVNVLHFATNEVINDEIGLNTLLQALADAMFQCVADTLLPAVTSDWTFKFVDAKQIFPAPSDPVVATAPAGSVGERGPTSVSFASQLVNIRTGGGGKSGRGRTFYPPSGEADMNASEVDNAVLLLIAQYLACVGAKFLGAAPTENWRLGVLSHKILVAGVGGGFNNAFRVANNLVGSSTVAVMRSRKKGHGS